jgi:hypothetical protein
MITTFQIIALSSLDPDGDDGRNEPKLSYADALVAARQMQEDGTAYRVLFQGDLTTEERQRFIQLGALV